MKYKLINKETEEEHICSKITLERFDYFYSEEKPLIGQYTLANGSLYKVLDIQGDDFKTELCWVSNCVTIIATNNSDVDIPKIEDAFSLAKKHGEIFSLEGGHRNYAAQGYLDGYNKSQETYCFTGEDMLEFLKFIQDNYYYGSGCWINCENNKATPKSKILELWKETQIKTIYFSN